MEHNKPKNSDRFPKSSSEMENQTSRGDTQKVLHETASSRGTSRQQKRLLQHDKITGEPSLEFFDRVPRKKYTKVIDYDKGPCVTSFGDILSSMGLSSLGSWLGVACTEEERRSKRFRTTEDSSDDDEQEENVHEHAKILLSICDPKNEKQEINLEDINEGEGLHKLEEFMATNLNIDKPRYETNPLERETGQSTQHVDPIPDLNVPNSAEFSGAPTGYEVILNFKELVENNKVMELDLNMTPDEMDVQTNATMLFSGMDKDLNRGKGENLSGSRPTPQPLEKGESSKGAILPPETETKYEFCSLSFYAPDILDPRAWDLHTINPDKFAKDE